MKERRYQKAAPSISQVWTGIWLALLAFFVVLWATDAPAQYYDREQPYRGWYADMERHERRQVQLLEEQEYRRDEQEILDMYRQNKERARRYNEKLRSGEW